MAEEIIMSNENKIKLGRLIRIYQKEQAMTIFDLSEGVCSKQIITNFNKDIPAKSDDVYLEILAKFGLSYNYNHNLDDYILKQSKELRDALEWYDMEKVKRICLETIANLEPYKKYVFEYENWYAFKTIYKFHFVDIKVEEETQHFLKTISFLNNHLADVLKDALVKFYYRFHDFTKGSKACNEAEKLLEILDLENSTYCVCQSDYFAYSLLFFRHLDCLKIFDKLEKYYVETKNFNGLIDLYAKAFILVMNIQDQSLEVHENKFMELINQYQHVLNKQKIELGIMNLAICYFEKGNFEKAQIYFSQSILVERYYLKSAICLNLIHSIKNQLPSELSLKPLKENMIGWESEKIFYKYYLKKYVDHANEIELIEYIEKDIMEHLKSKGSLYQMVFSYELETLEKKISNEQIDIKRRIVKDFEKIRNNR